MNTEKGKLYLKPKADNQLSVVFRPVNGTVWMDRNELCELFGVYLNQLNPCLDNILKSNTFRVDEACKYHRIVKNNEIEFDITEVNLEVIIALAFQIESTHARSLRKWFVDRVLSTSIQDCKLTDYLQNYSLN